MYMYIYTRKQGFFLRNATADARALSSISCCCMSMPMHVCVRVSFLFAAKVLFVICTTIDGATQQPPGIRQLSATQAHTHIHSHTLIYVRSLFTIHVYAHALTSPRSNCCFGLASRSFALTLCLSQLCACICFTASSSPCCYCRRCCYSCCGVQFFFLFFLNWRFFVLLFSSFLHLFLATTHGQQFPSLFFF